MAGLVLELVLSKQKLDVEESAHSGATASIAAASLLGAPLCMTSAISAQRPADPVASSEKRMRCPAGEANFVICFTTRAAAGAGHLARAFDLLAAGKARKRRLAW